MRITFACKMPCFAILPAKPEAWGCPSIYTQAAAAELISIFPDQIPRLLESVLNEADLRKTTFVLVHGGA